MYSVQIETSDGTLTRINLGIQYFEKNDVTVYRNEAEVPLVLGTDWQWDGDSTIVLLKGAEPVGNQILVFRNTDKDRAFNIYDGGAPFSRDTLDENFKQMIYLAQEFTEGSGIAGLYRNLNMHGNRIINLGDPIGALDATNKQYVDAQDLFYDTKQSNWNTQQDAEIAALKAGVVDQTAHKTVPWLHIAVGGETTISPPFVFQSALVFINGVNQYELGNAYSIANNTVTLAEPLLLGDEVLLYMGSRPAAPNEYLTVSEVDAMIKAGYKDTLGVLTPEMFYTTGDYTVAISAAIDAAVATNKQLLFQSGKTYSISSDITKVLTESQTLNINFNEAKLLQVGNISPLTFQNAVVGSVTAVTALSNVPYNLGNGATNTTVTKFTIPGHPFTDIGQVGKVFSDDVVLDSDATGQFRGEFFVVGAIDGADVYTTGVVTEGYATNIKVVRPSKARLKLSNLSANSVWVDAVNSSFITVRGFIKPTLAGHFSGNDLNATFVSITSCYSADVSGTVSGNRLKNMPTLAAYGYLFNDSASYGTNVNIILSTHARHGYTTTTPSAVANDDRWDLRGRTMYSRVSRAFSQGNANSIDTHSPAYSISFDHVTTGMDYRGNDTGGAGAQLRANSCYIGVLEVYNSKIGLAISAANKTSDSHTTIGTVRVKTVAGSLPITTNGSSTYRNRVSIDNLVVDTQNDVVLSATNSEVYIGVIRGDYAPTVNSGSPFLLNEGTTLSVASGALSILSGTGHVLTRHAGTLSQSTINMSVTGATRLAYLASSASQYDIEADYTVQLDAWAGTPFLGYPTTSPKVRARIRVGFSQAPLRSRVVAYNTAGNKALDIAFSGDASIVYRIEAQIAGVVINSVSAGTVIGQMLCLNNRNTSTDPLVIQNNSAGLLPLGTAITLTAGMGCSLIWDGAAWRRTT